MLWTFRFSPAAVLELRGDPPLVAFGTGVWIMTAPRKRRHEGDTAEITISSTVPSRQLANSLTLIMR
ncbi:hypothetical protein J1614_007426 [Plenodomus biglobosus]|nr:hypothetical protein J1614_007426 [Plenodomus biglobosus]